MWPLSAREIAGLVGGELAGDPEAPGERVTTDSRGAARPGDVFVGLPGPHFDGGRFAAQVLEAGASVVVAARARGEGLSAAQGRAVVTVDSPLEALRALAREARRRFEGTVVAVTGSNGKTLVKDMLLAALAGERRVAGSPQSYNSQVGVALSLLGLDAAADLAVIECGISLPGEMARQAELVRPDCGILTNVGDAHVEGLGSREVTAREKALLFAGLDAGGWALTLEGERLGREALAAAGAEAGAIVLLVGGSDADFRLQREPDAPLLSRAGQTVRLPARPAAAYLVDDAALAAAAALLLGATPNAIEEGLAGWRPAPMRLEISTTPRGVLLINDAYTADPVSVEAALQALARERSRSGSAIAVLAGMAQLGMARRAAHERAGRRVAELGLDRLIGVGAGGEEIAAAALAAGMAAERVHSVAGVAEAAMVLDEHCRAGDRVLLKGSRPERLERVAAALFDPVASARLYVDLDAVVENFRAVRHTAGRERAVMAVVKSFGYGLDTVRTARALERAGTDAFAVAYPDEGIALRDRGISAPILVQNVLALEAEKLVRYGLAAEVTAAEQVGFLAEAAAAERRAVAVHLKIDTGMGRAGAFAEEAVALARAVEGAEWLTLEGLMTHFAAAEDPAHDDFTRTQIRGFDAVREALADAGFKPRWVHAANSAALARFPEARYNMVRAGLALLGYSEPDAAAGLTQRPVLRLLTRVVSVKELPPGHAVGYGLTYRTPDAPRRVAVAAVGYGDGYPWALSNKGWMAVAGHRCPVVGRVSMDVTTLDVTDAGEVRPGDEVVVFGPGPDEPSLPALAEAAGTLPYELLTRISARVRRIFQASH